MVWTLDDHQRVFGFFGWCLIDNSVSFETHQKVSRLLFAVDGVGVDAGSVWLEGRFICSLKPTLHFELWRRVVVRNCVWPVLLCHVFWLTG
jgi:hypothetical protein